MPDDVHHDSVHISANFPLNLRIHPSRPPPYLTKGNTIDDANFGSLAQELAIRQYGIAGRVWEAAYMMNLYVLPPPDVEFDPPFIDASKANEPLTMIELGSGTGVVASHLARLLNPGRDHLIVTDLPEVCTLLERNLQDVKCELESEVANKDTLIVRPLSWGKPADAAALAAEFFRTVPAFGSLSHIICSDLVYFPVLLAPLLRSLLHLSSPPFYSPTNSPFRDPSPTLLISYKIRSLAKETPFWSAFGLWFDFQPVLSREKKPSVGDWQRFGAKSDDMSFLFIARRRPESFAWAIPELDQDLLEGVGANGSSARKSDDTFENLLLMGLEDPE